MRLCHFQVDGGLSQTPACVSRKSMSDFVLQKGRNEKQTVFRKMAPNRTSYQPESYYVAKSWLLKGRPMLPYYPDIISFFVADHFDDVRCARLIGDQHTDQSNFTPD